MYVFDSAHNVIDKFNGLGGYEGQLTGFCEAPGTCVGTEVPFFAALR